MRSVVAAAALAGGYRRSCQCDPAVQSKNPHRVLIVGAGITGSLTASLIRRRWPVGEHTQPLDLHVWERASYPAGRFGAVAKHGEAVADLGAQVLSAVDPNDERAREGHGITKKVLRFFFFST